MKITILGSGTSQGVPVIGCPCRVCMSEDQKDKRLRCAVLIEDDGYVMVIDSGPDFRQQMLRHKVKRLDALIFTHEHKDHTAGLDDIRAFNYIQGKPVDVYASPKVQTELRKQYNYIFEEKTYPGIPELTFHTITDKPFSIGSTVFQPIEVSHYRLPVLGFRVGGFTYITDANFISPKEKEKIKGSDILVVNALRREKHISHFTLDEAIELAVELKPGTTYLTHISHQMGRHAEISSILPESVQLAYDGLTLTL